MARILLLHWGRTAAGPALTLKLAREMIADGRHEVFLSYSAQADIVEEFRAVSCSSFEVSTWGSVWGVPKAAVELPRTIIGLRRFMRKNRINVSLVPMEQPMQSLAAWAFGAHGARQILFMHDASLHLGERSPIIALLRRFHIAPADEVVVFSDSVREGAIANWGLDPEHVHLTDLPPMFDAPEPSAPRRLPEDRAVVCGMFGRAVAYKGFDIAVEAVAALRADGRDVELRLVGAGVTGFIPAEYRSESWLHLEDRWLADDEITALISSFDILLLPYREASQSGVLVESAALGVPAVVTPMGGLPEQIATFGCGEVSETVDAESVARSAAKLLDDPAYYADVAATARARAAAPKAWGRLLDELDPLL